MRQGAISIALALTIFLAGWRGIQAAGSVPASGHVAFGRGINHLSLGVTHPLTSVRHGAHIWFSAHFNGLPGITIRLAISRVLAGGNMRFVGAVSEPMPDPRDSLYASPFHAALPPGTYLFEFIRGSSLLAEGKLRITR